MKRLGILLITFVLVLAIALPASAALASSPAKKLHAGQFVNAANVPDGSVLVVNVTFSVTNDIDSGFQGNWALDNYNKHVQIWRVPDGSFYVVASYIGKWQTFEGAPSPMNGILQGAGATGTMQGGYIGTLTGTLNVSPAFPQYGNIGSFDYGGTSALIYSDEYTPFDWIGAYFNTGADFSYVNWGWTYTYRNQTWNNFQEGSSGDIVIP